MTNEEFDELRRLIHGYEELTDVKSLFRKLAFIDAWIIGTMRFKKLKDLQDFELKEEMKKFEQGFSYKAPEKNSEWINVKDRLPDMELRILAVNQFNEMQVCYLQKRWENEIAKFWINDSFEFYPSHWMPLPQTPEQYMNEGKKMNKD